MAWRARILNFNPGDTALTALVEVGFYDDANPANVPLPTIFLYRNVYQAEQLTTVAEFTARLKQEGRDARTAYERVNAVRAALPIGTEISI